MEPSASADVDRSDTSRYSYYVDDDFYRHLLEDFAAREDSWLPTDRPTRDEVEDLLIREARLLDDGRLEQWGQLWTPDCLYWVPISPGGGDPTSEATLAFDDRRRLEDRIYWLRTGMVWGQMPPSRTSRMISNLEVSLGRATGELWSRCNFVIREFRAGRHRTLAGRYLHTLRREDGDLRIVVKRVDLIDSEHGHELITIIL